MVTGETYKKNINPCYKLRRFYLPSEVATHNTADDCWVSFFNQVYDLTQLIAENSDSQLCDPIVLAAGSDITHWFDPKTREPKTYVDPVTNTKEFLCPNGRYLHVPPRTANSDAIGEVQNYDIPWWLDENYAIGRLTRKVRSIMIINCLTKDE